MKKRYHLLLTLPFLLVLCSITLLLSAPYLLDSYLFPSLFAGLPFSTKEISLSRVSPWTIRGTLTLAEEKSSSLHIPKFEIHYSPSSLRQGRVDRLLLDSMAIELEIEDGKPVFRGLTDKSSANENQNKTLSLLSPLALEAIVLKNCIVSWKAEPQRRSIRLNGRFSLDFQQQGNNQHLFTGLGGEIDLSGALALQGKVNLQAGQENSFLVRTEFKTDDISQLKGLVPGLAGMQLSGKFDLKTQAHVTPNPGQLENFNVELLLANFHLKKDTLTLAAVSPDDPVSLNLTGDLETLHYEFNNLAIVQPEQVALKMHGDIALQERTLEGTGQLSLARTNSTVKISYQGEVGSKATTLNYQLAGTPFKLSDMVSLSPLKIEGVLVQPKGLAADSPQVTGSLKATVTKISLLQHQTSLIGLSLELPLQYPLPAATNKNTKKNKGTLIIDKILHQGTNSGRLRLSFQPTAEKIFFNSLFTSPFVPGLRLECDGETLLAGDTSLYCDVPATDFASTTLPPFAGIPDKLSFDGKLAASGQFNLTDMRPSGKLQLHFLYGNLYHGENKLRNINLKINFPNLPLLQSSPSQLCTIGTLDLGKIKMSDARVHYRIEDSSSVFLEKIRLNWCGGKVETGSFRLATEMKELETTLYCDRLGFTELLGQFGISQAEGQGSLNGRLPMRISKNGLVFDDGFLFSTPGNSGIIRFNDTNQLRQGIPAISQSAYLDYSMNALENFSYNWTKLTFNSLENDLLIAMQLDGKPAEPLPYGYNEGQIVPTTKGPGLQHPIRLDVNFRLPIQDMFEYGQNIQSFMENM